RRAVSALMMSGVLMAGLLDAPPLHAATPSETWTAAERGAALATLHGGGELLDVPDTAVTDAALEAAVVRHATVELGQRLRPSAVDRVWALDPARIDVPAALTLARQAGRLPAWLDTLSPPFAAYRDLESLRRHYQQIVAAGGWKALPPGPAAQAGARSPLVTALRTRLELEGYATSGTDPALFDAGLQRALADFQTAHDLTDTARLDAATRAALDIPATTRLAAIEANLERWRWLPHVLPPSRIELDVAGAEAVVFEAGAPVLQMRAIVGDPRHRTPIFASRLTAVVFAPPWNVPKDIADEEILPKAARDPGYLARNDFDLVDGRVVQRPGPKNALGNVKFDLPSPFGVYLHDTPARTLFARRTRTLSHGCMRLEKPQALAEHLLTPQGWTPDAVAAAMAAGQTQAVSLKQPLPLFVVYWTVTTEPGGRGHFRPDPYGWDRALTEALARASETRIASAATPPATECAAVGG
ncbi:MAG: L,D-transpeptidase family protein, partial [Phenylobacterium sp.]